jgi:diaminohydroxyphosphoribosylaminopyrimidine deaminase/5-amino-6-(5-phosphoribosylamino)uracil reductase
MTTCRPLSADRVAEVFREALTAADAFAGATAPNPPVGCAVLDADGPGLAAAAHPGRARTTPKPPPSPLSAMRRFERRIDTLVVTLEPCNHTGRTPPCVEAILATPARRTC